MANRYWVGGTASWDGTAGTKWALTSGGLGGQAVPTSADDVFFDGASGANTVTIASGNTGAKSINCTGFTGTLAGSVAITVSGSVTLSAGMTNSYGGNLIINGSGTLTSAGKTLTTGGLVINGTGITVNLGDALVVSPNCGVTTGTFNTNGYAVTAAALSSSSASARTINLGSSTLTLTGASGVDFTTNTNLTFNAGTSSIVCSGATSAINGGSASSTGVTFYNVSFTSTTAGTKTVGGINTFNNFAVTAPSAAGLTTVNFNSGQTINGTLSTTGTAGNRRVWFAGLTYGIAQTLTINSAPSLTDADFRGIYVIGTAAPISGTRIGNRGECRGITFSTPKTVYWNLSGAQNWSANGWAATSTGSPSTDNFPLPQDTATFTDSGSVTGTITLDTAIAYVPNVDMSGRTSAMTLSLNVSSLVYGNWTNGSGTSITTANTLTFSGGSTQTITSAGKPFPGAIIIDTYGGTVQLADALNIGSGTLTVTNGAFNTNNFNVTAGSLASTNNNVRSIAFGSSTVTLSLSATAINFTSVVNFTFNAGTSQINLSAFGSTSINSGALAFYNVSFSTASSNSHSITGDITFNNLSVTAPSSAGILTLTVSGNQTINGTLTCAGATAVRRVFVRSDTLGTTRTLTVGTLSAQNCDFRDITIAGGAAGSSPTRAGDCGGNSGITFPAAKTVYWNLAGAQNWSATGWAPGTGGTPDINNFPLAQDTAKFDEAAGSVTGTIAMNAAWNIGTFDASARTSAMTLTTSTNAPFVYGDWKFGTGVTLSSTSGTITFAKRGTQTVTSNGITFGCPITVDCVTGTVQLADALTLNSARILTLTTGTFDAVTYNVTTGLFSSAAGTTTKMGTGTWTLSGTGTVWTGAGTNVASSSTIVLSNTSTSARTFAGGGLYYNKLTIGGTTGVSTLTITGANIFGELASTKTVAHTIVFPSSSTTTIGKWSVTGTSGNVVTLAPSTAATAYTISIAGPANSGIDYLSVSYCAIATNPASPGELYVGVNSTNTAGNTGSIIFTATPTPRTLYWVGGTGNWSDTARWSTSSGSGSGAAIPTSLDAVNFNSGSNATAYTATIDAGVTIARCASFTMAGPAAGNVTFAGSVNIAMHGNVSFAATGITRTYTGAMFLAGNSSYTFTTNGLALSSTMSVLGIGATWTLGSALNNSGSFSVTYGTFSTSASNYSLTTTSLSSNNSNIRTLSLNASTVSVSAGSSTVVNLTPTTNFTFNAGTSQIDISNATSGIASGGLTFNNVSFTSAAATGITITGANTFNTLSFAGRTTVGITPVTFSSDQTITTLTLNAGTAAAYRTFLASNTIGTQRTLSVGTLTAGAADYDFRDIAITGGASPIAPTRAGDCKGNSGITFPGAKTVYYRQTGSADWGTTGSGSWSDTSGSAFDATKFPLAQDTAIFPAATYPASGSTTTLNAAYNIGTIDMQNRTGNTMTLATGSIATAVYGNWINGTGMSFSGTGQMLFAGRGSQTITNAGRTFTQQFGINTPGGSVTLQDAFIGSQSTAAVLTFSAGTFDANGFNVTLSGATSGINVSGTSAKTIAFGSGTWTIAGTGGWASSASPNLTVTGAGTVSLTSASAKTFAGAGASYSSITLNQGGAGALTITGNNTFKDITNTYSATGAANITLGTTTQTVTQWTGTGTSGKVLTVQGTSASSPGTLILSGATKPNVDYLALTGVRAYSLTDTWYAGANSTNNGSLGWYFSVAPAGSTGNFLFFFPM